MVAPRIDSHQHFWRYSAAEFGWIDDAMTVLRRDFLPADLEPLLRAKGIGGCIAVQAPQTLAETRFLLDLARRHPWILGVVGWVDLRSPHVDAQLREFAADAHLVGIRHIAEAEPDPRFLVSEPVLRGIAALQPHALAFDLLVRPHQLPAAAELAARFPAQRFVLDHLGKPDLRQHDLSGWATDLRSLARNGNVVGKVSGLVTEADWHRWRASDLLPALEVAAEAFGPERLLFGSDWPVCLCAASHARWTETVEQWLAPWPAADQAAVFGGNAARVYGLPGGTGTALGRRRDA